METGTNQQNIENPLFLLPLFGKEIFVLKSDIQSLSTTETNTVSPVEAVKIDSPISTINPNESTEQILLQNQSKNLEHFQHIQEPTRSTQTIKPPSTQDGHQFQSSKEPPQSEKSQPSNPIRLAEQNEPLKSSQPPKQKVKLLNVFVDKNDGVFSDEALIAYEKLMTNLKIEGIPLQFADVALINSQNSIKVKSILQSQGIQVTPDLWNEFDADYCVIWSDSPLILPAMKHFSMSSFNNLKLIFLPGFKSMLSSPELKKSVWIAFNQLLRFV